MMEEKQFIINGEEEDLEVTHLENGELLIHVCPHKTKTAAIAITLAEAQQLAEWILDQLTP